MEDVKQHMDAIQQAMIDDGMEPGSYAHTWHCNIAMACFDAIEQGKVKDTPTHEVCNDAASRFMKICFNVETKN